MNSFRRNSPTNMLPPRTTSLPNPPSKSSGNFHSNPDGPAFFNSNGGISMNSLHRSHSNNTGSNSLPQLQPSMGGGILGMNSTLPPIPTGAPIPAPRNANMVSTSVTLVPSLLGGNSAAANLVSSAGLPLSNTSSGSSKGTNGRPRPQPISGTPPPEAMDKCDDKLVQQTCSMFGLDIVSEYRKMLWSVIQRRLITSVNEINYFRNDHHLCPPVAHILSQGIRN